MTMTQISFNIYLIFDAKYAYLFIIHLCGVSTLALYCHTVYIIKHKKKQPNKEIKKDKYGNYLSFEFLFHSLMIILSHDNVMYPSGLNCFIPWSFSFKLYLDSCLGVSHLFQSVIQYNPLFIC